MKKYLVLLASVLVLSSTSVGAKTLKLATVVPAGSSWMKEMKAAAKEIKKETDGRVKLKFFPGGIMGSDKSVLRKIRVGQLHGGAISAGALAHLYNGMQLYSLPFTFKTTDEVTHVRETFDPIIKQGLAKKGFELMAMSQGGFAYIMSNKSVTEIDDLKTQKVWLPEGDQITQEIYDIAGVQANALPISDVYTGLQTGLLDTVAINPAGAIALQWHTKVENITDKPLLMIMGTLVISQKALKNVKAEDKKVIRQQLTAAFAKLDKMNVAGDIQARQALEKNGIVFTKTTTAENLAWENLATKALEKLKAKGIYPASEYLKLQKLLLDYRSK